MDEAYTPILTEEERARRRAQRSKARQERQRQRRRRLLRRIIPAAAAALVLLLLLTAARRHPADAEAPPPEEEEEPLPEVTPEEEPVPVRFTPAVTADTVTLPEGELYSQYAVVMDAQSGKILAQTLSDTVISPASMTKVLTLLVASESIIDPEDTFTITIDITDYCYLNGCSAAGFALGETVTVRDLLYGTILPSGADAAVALAIYAAGSHEAFVDRMNEKLADLGLSATAHFTNCVGLYDADHHCTVRDMAVILKAAMDDPLCREVLGARVYTTSQTEQHPEGLELSNWFLRRIEDRFVEGPLQVIGAKTGYVSQSGSCAASCARREDGREFLCVTGNASGAWRAIYDHTALYQTWCK
ncbi:MAG: D-alanyl-D-alanine carboxypeptidase [Oscillibacter sp.]|nr:D-alanyl-D-alanine carboxypeptidase [Oscillibacter sp.]